MPILRASNEKNGMNGPKIKRRSRSPSSFPIIAPIRKKIENKLLGMVYIRIYRSAIPSDPKKIANELATLLAISAFSSACFISFILLAYKGVVHHNPYSIVIFTSSIALPMIEAIHKMLLISSKSSKRKNNCEREIPFVATFLSMAAASGISVQLAFERLKNFQFFPQFKEEALRIEKVRRLYALNPYEAMQFEGNYHPSEMVKELYSHAIVAQKEGNAVHSALKDELMKIFSIMQGRLRTVSDKFSLIASAEMVSFIMLPMALITIGVLFSNLLGINALLALSLIFPTFAAIALGYLADSFIPKELTEDVDLKPFFLALCGLPASIAIYLALSRSGAHLPFYYVFGATSIFSLLPASLYYSSKRKAHKSTLGALPTFTRFIAEEVKKGVSPHMAMVSLSNQRAFNEHFDAILHWLSAYLRTGAPISSAIRKIRAPWVARATFELLNQAEIIGAEPTTLDSLSDLVSNLHLNFKSLESQARFFILMTYVNSFILAFSVLISVNVVGQLFTNVGSSMSSLMLPLGLSFVSASQYEAIEVIAFSSVIYNSFLLGILGGKASSGGSVVDGLPHSVVCISITIFTILVFKGLGLIGLLFGAFGGIS